MSGLYFEGSYPELERRLEDHFSRVRQSFETAGHEGSLVLGGGYGRGEGGVLKDRRGTGFSNDLDYFFFNNSPGDGNLLDWCRKIEQSESAELGIDVEIKTLRRDSIGDPSQSMMFADLVAGHVVVAGEGGFLTELRNDLDFSKIEPEEATRLLWNRGSGMFFSRCRMKQNNQMIFVIRNHAKLKLALGDGWLCLNKLYTSKCRERGERLSQCELPAKLSRLREWHREGVKFKFEPFSEGVTWEELERESQELIDAWGMVYLAVEQQRLGKRLEKFADYLSLPRILQINSFAKNLLLALRDQLKRGAHLRPLGDYPRAGLMRSLPCLLGLTEGGVSEASRFLPKPEGDSSDVRAWEKTYTQWWSHYA